ncbi:alpha/beta hydrolase family protein [Emydomyces testavorans]|uniref:Alpha/beta hydrolase family protein n=1 Tax=Emydomyces testavorans TaxID=2070801 RepID=A0AAF0IHE4_9EURO|nr:alpha/beta hydrolase family protein [Emydomyces testavorans]
METEKTVFPDTHIVEPQTAHTHTAILLHGRGSNGPEFAEDLFSSKTSAGQNLAAHFPSWRWVFPTARNRWSTVFEEDQSAWFDIYSLTDTNKRQDLQRDGLRESCLHVLDVIERETDLLGGQSGNVIFGGMSQGMATALWTLLCAPGRIKRRIGAFVGSCGWMPFTQHIEKAISLYGSKSTSELNSTEISAFLLGAINCPPFESEAGDTEAALSTPVLLLHGTDDAVVDISLGQQACQLLREMGMKVELKEYSGAENDGHWIKEPQGFDEIVAFLAGHTG